MRDGSFSYFYSFKPLSLEQRYHEDVLDMKTDMEWVLKYFVSSSYTPSLFKEHLVLLYDQTFLLVWEILWYFTPAWSSSNSLLNILPLYSTSSFFFQQEWQLQKWQPHAQNIFSVTTFSFGSALFASLIIWFFLFCQQLIQPLTDPMKLSPLSCYHPWESQL